MESGKTTSRVASHSAAERRPRLCVASSMLTGVLLLLRAEVFWSISRSWSHGDVNRLSVSFSTQLLAQ